MAEQQKRQHFMMRMLPGVKVAADKAAEDANRSLSSYIETLLMERLKTEGYLK